MKKKIIISIKYFNTKILSNFHWEWVFGILLPLLYILVLVNFKNIINHLKTLNYVKAIFILFLLFQLISVILSFSLDFFTLDRFFAIVHNIVSFTFFIVGYYFSNRIKNSFKLIKSIKVYFYFISMVSIVAFIYSLNTNHYIQYPGLLALITGIKNDVTQVTFSHAGYLMNLTIPRSRIMGTFPNTTAILLLLVYTIYRIFSSRKTLLSGILLIIACITTGSRMATLIAIVLFIVQFSTSRRKIMFLLILGVLMIIPSISIFQKLISIREDSNTTRQNLYEKSINLTMDENPIFGIGIKPRIENIANGELPVGSHSTFIGYFVKNGFFGFVMITLVYISLFFFSFYGIFFSLFKKFIGEKSFFIYSSPVLISLVFLTDDFDSYELIPFFFGILIYLYELEIKKIRQTN